MAETSQACPVCLTSFAATDGAAFALHVASCTSASPPPSPTAPAHCARCLHVYRAGALPHEISFHEHECARVNELPAVDEDSEDSSKPKKKRPKRAQQTSAAVAAPSVSLFPSSCFLCGSGGRGLLRCGGSCARVAHQHCVDELQAPWTAAPLTGQEKKQAHDNWRCAQCVRSLHRCQRCGFLGHGSNDLRKCSVLDCGFFFHEQCLPQAQQETVHSGFVCSRHTCDTCGLLETDMRRCKSCTVCSTMTHLRCPRGTGGATTQTAVDATGLDPGNLFVCPKHDGEKMLAPKSSPDASNSLRLRMAAGDVGLVLEFSNALLPPSTKNAAPEAANHWGVVTATEEAEPLGCGDQLLTVRMFADDSVIVVPNRYVLRVASAEDFARPVDLIRHCLQRHAMVELQLRQQEGNVADADTSAILRASNAAFTARLEALGVTATQSTADAELGLARWRRFQALSTPRPYDGLGDSAPAYIYLDTRGSHAHQHSDGHANASQTVANEDGDVPMSDGDADMPPARASAGPWADAKAGPTGMRRNGQGPSDANEGVSNENSNGGHNPARNNVMARDAHLPATESARNIQPPAQVAPDKTPSTQDTEMQFTQDTQQDNNSQTMPPDTTVLAVSTVDVNSTKRAAEAELNASAKRQKIAPIIASAATTCSNTHNLLVTPGATSSGASLSSNLHISPMSGIARKQQDQASLPQKRKQLTRKQKLLAGMPPLVLAELEREAMAYLGATDASTLKPASPPAPPSDVEFFPWAARADQFRLPFYRPTVVLGHSGLRRSGVESVSRLLVSQDKRNVTCFVQVMDVRATVSSACLHSKNDLSSPSAPMVMLDLLGLRSFRELEATLRSRLLSALSERPRYMFDVFGDADKAKRWLDQLGRKKLPDQTPISIWYCTGQGARCRLELPRESSTDMKAWLCFCANVHHLTVMVSTPNVKHSAKPAIAAQPQQLPVTSSAK